MTWYYACKKVTNYREDTDYEVIEVYPEIPAGDENVSPHTQRPIFFGETPEELVKWLRKAADDIEKHGCINEETEE